MTQDSRPTITLEDGRVPEEPPVALAARVSGTLEELQGVGREDSRHHTVNTCRF